MYKGSRRSRVKKEGVIFMSKDRRHNFKRRICTRFKTVIGKKGRFKGKKIRRPWKWKQR